MGRFEKIEAFIAVVEEESFAAAARKYGVSTPAISRHIAHLEAELNEQLLVRTTRKLQLTALGRQYYERCKEALETLTEAESMIRSSQKEASGSLSVLVNRYFAHHYILPKIPEFLRNNPKIQLKIDLAERFPNFGLESIDIVYGITMEGAEDLVRKRVAQTRYMLVASPQYLQKMGTPRVPTDLKTHNYLSHSMRKPNNKIIFNNHQEIKLEPILWLNDSFALCEAALLGMGIAMLHDYMVFEALKDGRLVEVLEPYLEKGQMIYLYYQKNRYLQPKLRKFIDFFSH